MRNMRTQSNIRAVTKTSTPVSVSVDPNLYTFVYESCVLIADQIAPDNNEQ